MKPGLPELLVILVIVLVVFGAGRIRRVFGELGGGIAEFRKGLREGSSDEQKLPEDNEVIRK
ncbi:MAG: twin-arginine translocase TatA/TatE family subunit [Chloroflexi bacterium]|nr:MAG: twin arginine-targeting protein translocase [Chloroflexi bacterium OLB13]MBC6955794.1 twin-arginine translocase TatA/TatE family subunit [Chloroflexota bacterium]MBV6437286.1 Sec-independent protein translocase protein TatA [Anaerolineae bacterium]MDL1915357.1 twin-arginine translocase TatA/TatE family subunit [Anaerolineae bacterium CFX4]OQY83472.1 MAG: hypothetical protein B6D42_07520 [Anaerolineae bacterium UTCFX5]